MIHFMITMIRIMEQLGSFRGVAGALGSREVARSCRKSLLTLLKGAGALYREDSNPKFA